MIISEKSLNFVPEICQIVKQGLKSQGTGPGVMGLIDADVSHVVTETLGSWGTPPQSRAERWIISAFRKTLLSAFTLSDG